MTGMTRRTMRQQRTAARGGFTLLEVLLVLVILGVLGSLVVPNLLGRQQKAMIDSTKSSIKGLEEAAKQYAIDHDGELPNGTQDAISKLIEPVDRDGKAMKPYLDKIPKDAWGAPLRYEYPNTKAPNSTTPAIWSSGPNKQDEQGGGDDVNNWAELFK